jgi:hypothetical protein
VHKRQVLGDARRITSAAVHYCGSPYPQNWGELETDKGVLLVQLPVVEPVFPSAPLQYVTIAVSLRAPCFRVIDLREKPVAAKQAYTDDFVRVIVDRVPTPEWLAELKAQLQCRTLEFDLQRGDRVPAGDVARRSRAHMAMERTDLCAEYVRAVPLLDEQPKAVLAAGLKLLGGDTK